MEGVCTVTGPPPLATSRVSWGFMTSPQCWNPPWGWGQTPTTTDKLMRGGDRPFIGELSQTQPHTGHAPGAWKQPRAWTLACRAGGTWPLLVLITAPSVLPGLPRGQEPALGGFRGCGVGPGPGLPPLACLPPGWAVVPGSQEQAQGPWARAGWAPPLGFGQHRLSVGRQQRGPGGQCGKGRGCHVGGLCAAQKGQCRRKRTSPWGLAPGRRGQERSAGLAADRGWGPGRPCGSPVIAP